MVYHQRGMEEGHQEGSQMNLRLKWRLSGVISQPYGLRLILLAPSSFPSHHNIELCHLDLMLLPPGTRPLQCQSLGHRTIADQKHTLVKAKCSRSATSISQRVNTCKAFE